MKKILRLAYPFGIFPAVFLLYMPINQFVVLKWLGSGGPVITASGVTRMGYFSANGFSRIFLAAVSAAAVFLSVFNLKRIAGIDRKIVYLLSVSLCNIFCFLHFTHYTMWK